MARTEYTGKLFQVYIDGDKAWELIEQKTMGYNVDMDILYPEHFHEDKIFAKYQNVLDKIILKNEEYVLFNGLCDGYAITSFGRVLNAKHNNQVIVYFSKNNLRANVRTIKIDFATEFMKNKWSFNINTIKRRYNEYKWKYQQAGINYHNNPK